MNRGFILECSETRYNKQDLVWYILVLMFSFWLSILHGYFVWDLQVDQPDSHWNSCILDTFWQFCLLSQLFSLKIPFLFLRVAFSLSSQTRFLCPVVWTRDGHRIQICYKNHKLIFKGNYLLSVVESKRYLNFRSLRILFLCGERRLRKLFY